MPRHVERIRVAVIAAAFAIAGGVAGCRDFLKTTNPTAIDPATLNDTSYIPLMVGGAIGEYQAAAPTANYYMSVFSDELRNTHVYFEEGNFDRRDVDSLNGTFSVYVYAPMQRARWLADSVAGRLAALEGDSAKHDVRYARALAYAGYGLVTLAEMECGTPVSLPSERYSKALPSDQVFALAIARFDTAIQVATDARAAAAASSNSNTAATKAIIASADSVKDLAEVGAARAALNMGDKAKAVAYASAVAPIPGTTDFQFRIYFNSNTSLFRLNNPFRDRISGGPGVTTGVVSGTPFDSLEDARVPVLHDANGKEVPTGTMNGYYVVPNSPSAFSTFDGSQNGAAMDYGGWMRMASLLEAQYVLAEANGPTATSIAFVESRRNAYPSSTAQAPTTAANFLQNLIDQRRRDFFLDGHRIGDLRRYQKLYNLDLWQHGAVPGQTGAVFTDRTCLPLNLAEYQNNPAVKNP